MPFRFYSNMISNVSRGVASGIFILGLVLIGFGMIIFALPELFAFLAAAVFFIVGISCLGTGLKAFWQIHKFNKGMSQGQNNYRDNVQIHREEYREW